LANIFQEHFNLIKQSIVTMALCAPFFASAQSLTLSCDGQGSLAATQSTTVNQIDLKHKDQNQLGIVQTQTRRPFSGNGTVEISSGTGRMRIPDPMIPALMSGDTGGWYPIEDLFTNDREITGIVRINMLNKPKMRIDRMTGKLSMSGGLSDFAADCRAVEPQAKPKF
jgi:hypothetical protein